MYWLVIIFDLLIVVICNDSPSRLVNLNQGPVRGYKDLEFDLFAFYGIPYAKTPTGQEKFKAPLPSPTWSEPFEAVNDNIICPQSELTLSLAPKKVIKEDCLIVNVYTPETNGELLPVLVHFHGGAFALGFGDISHYDKVAKSKKIVLVTFNYRLGAHGFLCLGTKDVPGNAGMKDQVALLRWVKNNIANFGGNPDEVTLAGYNTGGSSIDLMMLSKMARGLFKRVIPDSGTNTAVFSVQIEPIKNAQRYAEYFKFENVDNFYELETFYKNLSYTEINSKNTMGRPDSTYLMSPCVERDVGEEIFLDDSPVNILKSGNYEKIPMLYGYGELDGEFRVPYFEFWEYWINTHFEEFIPADLKFKSAFKKVDVAHDIQEFYFGHERIGKETMSDYVDYFTDIMFAYPIMRSVKLQVEAGNNQIYLYLMSKIIHEFPSELPVNSTFSDQCPKTIGILNDWRKEQNNPYSPEDLAPMKDMIPKVWLNFITKGEPFIPGSKLRWLPVGADLSPYMHIGRTFKRKRFPFKKRFLLWDDIYEKYYVYPTAPPAPPPKDSDE